MTRGRGAWPCVYPKRREGKKHCLLIIPPASIDPATPFASAPLSGGLSSLGGSLDTTATAAGGGSTRSAREAREKTGQGRAGGKKCGGAKYEWGGRKQAAHFLPPPPHKYQGPRQRGGDCVSANSGWLGCSGSSSSPKESHTTSAPSAGAWVSTGTARWVCRVWRRVLPPLVLQPGLELAGGSCPARLGSTEAHPAACRRHRRYHRQHRQEQAAVASVLTCGRSER